MVPINLLTIKRTVDVLNKCSKLSGVLIRKHSVWTEDKRIVSPFKSVEVPNWTLYDYVWQNLDKWPERTISVCATTGRGYTYEQAFKLSNNFAANLRKKFKIRDGDVVAVMLPNIPDYPLVAMGTLAAGGVITSINPIYTAYEVQRQLLMSDAKIIITLPEIVKVVKDAMKIAKLDLPVIVIKTNGEAVPDKTVLFNDLSEDVNADLSCLKEVRRSSSDVCFLPYSSGTTGLPKGVELTHSNLVYNCEQINDPFIRSHNDTTATHQDTVMAVLPFFHIYGATVLMFHKMSVGVKILTLSSFTPEAFFRAIEKYKANTLYVAPPLALLMASHPASTNQSLQSLELIVNGAAPLSATDIIRFFDKIGRKLDFRQGYGLTETSPTVSIAVKGSVNYSSTGPPIPNTELRIADSTSKNMGPNETGEILIKGPQVMRGYRNNPEANKEVFTDDGWFKTGDLGFADEEGNLTIADRLKELIKVKGFQVPPAELEGIIREHPSVADAAVIGIPHAVTGEAPKAFIVLKAGQNASAKDISKFVRERLAPYKRVDDIVFLDNIPKSASGKILRRVLKEEFS